MRFRWKSAVKLVATVLVLVLLLRAIGWREVVGAFDGVDWRWLLAMYATLAVGKSVDAFQLTYVLRSGGMRVAVDRVFFANALAAFYSLFLPGDLAAAGAKWVDLSAATGQKAGVFNAIVYNRLTNTLLPVTVGGVALAVANPVPGSGLQIAAAVLFVMGIAAFLSLYNPRLGGTVDRVLRSCCALLPGVVEDRAGSVLDSMKRFRAFRVSQHLRVVGIATAAMLVGFAVLGCGMQALGIGVSPLNVIWTAAFMAISTVLPLTIGNLGIREGLLVVALAPFGVPNSMAVALGLLLFTNHIAIAIVGGIYQLTLLTGLAQWDGKAEV